MTTTHATVLPFRPRPERRRKLVSNGVLGMILFVFVEVMLFAGFISAFVIIKSRAIGSVWPPPNQPRLPVEQTAVNTAALIASGIVLLVAHRLYLRALAARRARADTSPQSRTSAAAHPTAVRSGSVAFLLGLATLCGGIFVALQGVEWLALIREGLTLTSSTYGALFYTIIGAHALHAIVAIGALLWALAQLLHNRLSGEAISTVALFWYFVVLVWPFLYVQVYL